jgi:hypothetical protein
MKLGKAGRSTNLPQFQTRDDDDYKKNNKKIVVTIILNNLNS